MHCKRTMLTLLLIGIVCSSCRDKRPSQETAPPSVGVRASEAEQGKKVIIRYNELLVEGYRALNMNRLGEVATPDQAEKAYRHMAAIGEGGARMHAAPKKIEFTGCQTDKSGNLLITTRELWDFSYRDIRTNALLSSETDFPYEVTYRLTQGVGSWRISEIVATSPRDARK